jgi:hypothetical protein
LGVTAGSSLIDGKSSDAAGVGRSPEASDGSWRLRASSSRRARLYLLHSLPVICLLLISCAEAPRAAAPMGADTVAVVPGFPSGIRRVGEDRQGFERRAPRLIALARQAAGGQPLNVLALSGGGSGGAFGAGALVGWTRQGTRPEFQIVTGVSAGALIAPLAFLGPGWDPQLAEAFSGSQTAHLMRRRLLGGLLGASVYDGKPLARLVNHYVTEELLRAVAQRSREGRLLLVATTDLDSEEPVIWNLGLIAEQGGPAARRLFRDVLIASSSVPGIFPPVMIPVEQGGKPFQEMHVDGSAINSLFFIPDVAAMLPDAIESLHGGHLYVLVNGRVQTLGATTRRQTFAIVRRSAVAAFQSGTRAAVEIAYSVSQRHGMDMSVTEIPNAYRFDNPLEFAPRAMAALFAYGERCALQEQLWTTPIDALAQDAAMQQSFEAAPCPGAVVQKVRIEGAPAHSNVAGQKGTNQRGTVIAAGGSGPPAGAGGAAPPADAPHKTLSLTR